MSQQVCIATPDVFGPIRNGGIGTAVFHQAEYFATRGIDVTCLYTNDVCESETFQYWKGFYDRRGIRLHILSEQVRRPNTMFQRWFLEQSLMVQSYLSAHDYDCVYFQDWQACGFHAIQARHVGLAFGSVPLGVVINSPHEWIHENANMWAERGDLYYPYLKWCERYCCEHADFLQAPSQYVFDWLQSRGWTLARQRFVTPYIRLRELDEARIESGRERLEVEREKPLVLAFFSRLETRKGLEIFLDALGHLSHRDRIARVSFLGREGVVSPTTYNTVMQPACGYIESRMKELGLPFEIVTNKNSAQAIAFLKAANAVAIMPSLAETFGLVVYECILHGIPFLCSDIPPFREMASQQCIFGTTPQQLANTVDQIDCRALSNAKHRIDPTDANRRWIGVLDQVTSVPSPKMVPLDPAPPLVSICVPYYNFGRYLPRLIQSLENSSYKNIEVVIVNDGSTDSSSNQVFADFARQYERNGAWKFISKNNGGIGETRNLAARVSKGEYLIFMDADNEAKPEMIATFVRCLRHSGADCLTCFLDCFDAEVMTPSPGMPLEWIYAPIGAAAEIGVFENTFGDANFVITRDAFFKVGGFKEDRSTSFEDYDLLARLCLQGFKQDVIPDGLVWYRVTKDGFSRTTNLVRNHRRVLQGFMEEPRRLDFRFFLEHVVLPMYYHHAVYRPAAAPSNGNGPLASSTPAEPDGRVPTLAAQAVYPDGNELFPTVASLALSAQCLVIGVAPEGSRRHRMIMMTARWFARLLRRFQGNDVVRT